MKTYNIALPSVDGVISHDYLYFEGVKCPALVYKIRDSGIVSGEDFSVLEKYFNDIYNLFLRKLSSFTMFEYTTDEETTKMQALLQELIKIKKLMENSTVDELEDLV